MANVRRLAFLLALAIAPATPADAASLPLEYAVKASYLYKFAPFVQWPPTAFAGPDAPLTICIAGPDPFGHNLEEAVRGQRVNGHPFRIEHIEEAHAGAPCQILFAGGEQTDEALRAVANRPVLTVTDHGEGGGIIQFVTVGGHVRFTINQAAAEQNGIAISSKLLELALKVIR